MKKYTLFFCVYAFIINAKAQVGVQTSSVWQFVAGDTAVPKNSSVYGSLGTIGVGNKPGARLGSVSWTDATGALWLFGGSTLGNGGSTFNKLNDLWKYNPVTNQWTFMKGNTNSNVSGIYGIRGIPADANCPGSREGSLAWTDATGNLWLFGGSGFSTGSTAGSLDDLWKYNPTTNQWTWIKGDNAIGVPGIYGSKGVTAFANNPGGRANSVGWTDNGSNFYVFGGSGIGSISSSGYLNDLWRYNVSNNSWTWLSGDSVLNQNGIYGTLQVPAATNKPGGRFSGAGWKDNNGGFWIFGGLCFDGVGGNGNINDLWKYDTATGYWTWMKGDNVISVAGNYGTMGITASTNKPGARTTSLSWVSATGELLLFGGSGFSDLWSYNTTNNNWTWILGDNLSSRNSFFGTQGVFAPANKPGGRTSAVSWKDATGNLWLFGGFGIQSSNPFHLVNARISDLWKLDVSINQWAWMKGDTVVNVPSDFGTPGVVSEGNNPGAREGASMWKDNSGNLWLFGGDMDTTAIVGSLKNDLWKYDVSTSQWIWMKGDATIDNLGVYGTLGVPAGTNKPGSRLGAVTWTDAAGNLWLQGGLGLSVTSIPGYLNDLWKYDPNTNNWTWIKGDNAINITGVYGAVGVPAAGNKPGGRYNATASMDATGAVWMFGGFGYNNATISYLNDLWKYDPGTNNWTWMKGDNTANNTGVYGVLLAPAFANKPGARYSSVSWADGSGNIWLFGGTGYHATANGSLNDLWKYTIGSGLWTWMKGDNTGNNNGVYGTQGVSAIANKPGARYGQQGWKDGAGNLWMFGGFGYGASTNGYLNDLWKYNPSLNQWTWMKGDNEANKVAETGTKGVPAANVKPGGTRYAGYQADGAGNFWLFGGRGYTPNGESLMNTMYSYNIATNFWTCLKGEKSLSVQGVYDAQGVMSLLGKPGARSGSVSWTDTTQNMWLFGGSDYNDYLNDLWKFDPVIKQWAWMKGDSVKNNFAGVYGTINVANANNKPGARDGSVSWTDTLGRLWLFGGMYKQGGVSSWKNDMWKYDVITNQWAWMKGDNTTNSTGVYGTPGTAAATNKPGAREGSASWRDRFGNLWMFGGNGFATTGTSGSLNDLWKYNPSTGFWTYMKGDNVINPNGLYATPGVAAPGNKPGGRSGSVAWADSSGKLWLFGGTGYTSTGTFGKLNDLWRYDPATNNWTWMKGDSVINTNGVFSSTPAVGNKPGAAEGGIGWTDLYNNLWLFGGFGYAAAAGTTGDLNDLWKYIPSTNQWASIKGDGVVNKAASYSGYDQTNKPGSRTEAVSWFTRYGDLWLFGGNGFGTSGTGYLNDLWRIFGGTKYVYRGNGSWSTSSQWLGFVAAPTNITDGIDVTIDHQLPGGCTNTGTITLGRYGRLTVEAQKLLTIDQGGFNNAGSVIGFGNLPGKILFTGTNNDSLNSSGSISTPIILSGKNMYLTGNTTTNVVDLTGTLAGRNVNAGPSTLTLGNYNLTMDTNKLVTDNSSFIITNGAGALNRYVSGSGTPVLFPVGSDAASYTPVTIANTGALDSFSVKVSNGVLSPGSVPTAVLTGNVNKSWYIEEGTEGGNNANVTVQWNISDEQSGFNRNAAYVAHKLVCPPPPPPNCDASFYDAVATAAASGSDPLLISRNNLTSFKYSPVFIVTSQPVVYTFINIYGSTPGDGNWANPANWTNDRVPPNIITAGMEVVISPIVGNECIFTGQLFVQPGGKITVQPGKKLTVKPF